MSKTHFLGPIRKRIAPQRLDTISLSGGQRAAAHMVASLLLDYPDDAYVARLDEVRGLIAQLPAEVAAPFNAYLLDFDSRDIVTLQKEFVTTFDLKRKCCLYLSYYAAGDTRRRGMALVTFQEAYRAAGWEFDAQELPDFLPVVLEFSALSDSPIAGQLLASHREGIEVLRAALIEVKSPYSNIVEGVCLTLPDLDEGTRERYLGLINEGPPTETVGISFADALQPFGASGMEQEEVRI